MAKLFIVCGESGTGKTTFANELSKRLKIFCLHKDTVKETLYDSMKMQTLEDSKKLGFPSIKTIMDLAEENLARGVDVILEAPFGFPDEGKTISAWKEKYDLDLCVIILTINNEERLKRFLNRPRHASHHDGERNAVAQISVAVDSNFGHMPEKRIYLVSDKPVEELVDSVLAQIK